jgi:hypothetical protein
VEAVVRRLALVVFACVLIAASCSDDSTSEAAAPAQSTDAASEIRVADAYTSVVVRVLGAPTFPFEGTDGRYHVAYDLELQNTSARVTATIEELDVVDATDQSAVVMSIKGDQLIDPECLAGDCDRLRDLTGRAVDDATIPPREGRILFVDFAADSLEDLPGVVMHRLVGQGGVDPGSSEPEPFDYVVTPYDISAGTPMSLAPPVAGDNWVALNGCCEPGFPHRSSPAPNSGQIVNGQRFAIDWKQMNDDGEFFEGDPDQNESYVDYGAHILAVADATVVATHDGMEANPPGVLPAADPVLREKITVETVDGNHIVLDLGNGLYAFYAHLLAGSLEVEVGDTVKTGDKIAELGNTGNSNASHLHFHVMDGPSILGSNGVPYVIDGFEYAGQVDPQLFFDTDDFLSGEFGAGRLDSPEARSDELPLLLTIIDFPSS